MYRHAEKRNIDETRETHLGHNHLGKANLTSSTKYFLKDYFYRCITTHSCCSLPLPRSLTAYRSTPQQVILWTNIWSNIYIAYPLCTPTPMPQFQPVTFVDFRVMTGVMTLSLTNGLWVTNLFHKPVGVMQLQLSFYTSNKLYWVQETLCNVDSLKFHECPPVFSLLELITTSLFQITVQWTIIYIQYRMRFWEHFFWGCWHCLGCRHNLAWHLDDT